MQLISLHIGTAAGANACVCTPSEDVKSATVSSFGGEFTFLFHHSFPVAEGITFGFASKGFSTFAEPFGCIVFSDFRIKSGTWFYRSAGEKCK